MSPSEGRDEGQVDLQMSELPSGSLELTGVAIKG